MSLIRILKILTITVISFCLLFTIISITSCKDTKSIEKDTQVEDFLEEETAEEEERSIKVEIPEEISYIEPYEIEIIGDNDFIEKTNQALDLLENKAFVHYTVVIRYIGIIEWADTGSGMFAWEDPPRYKVGEATVDAGTIWYAGTIVHDSIHSKQYNDYLAENPSGPVPDEVWTGESAEAKCLNVQYDALEKIGAGQQTLDYIKNAIDTKYWEVPYEDRWW